MPEKLRDWVLNDTGASRERSLRTFEDLSWEGSFDRTVRALEHLSWEAEVPPTFVLQKKQNTERKTHEQFELRYRFILEDCHESFSRR